ncbi:MAG: S-layer homology domain-containing protein [Pseudoflavonifractor sp.]|nr:S-layer homology domain-containing protein [Pseudoflavonifractor sp.]
MNTKRLFSGLTAMVLAVSLFPAAHGVQAGTDEMAQVLSALDIMTGNENGDLMLFRNVTRSEFTKLIIAASTMGENVGASTTVSPYPDVPHTHWAAPYVEAAVSAGYVNGYLDGTFHPDEPITLAMGVSMAVRLLGYSDTDFSGAWPSGQMTLYRNLDLDEGITSSQNSAMTRQDAMCLLYNLLTAPTKSGQVYLTTLGHSLTAAGEIDRVALINSAMDGPVVMTGSWKDTVNFDVSRAAVYRGGNLSSLSALQANDVIYWSKSMHTLWAYSNKVTGLYQNVSPNASSPTSVTVAGKTYSIETAAAAYSLSNLGSYKTGDTITLLLGRDGGVAAVASSGSVSGTLYGVVSSVSNAPYTDSDGSSYSAKTVAITAADGNSYSYPVEASSSLKAGNLVQITLSSGSAKVIRLNQSSLSGKVNSTGTKVGNTVLAAGAGILDVNSDGAAVKLYPSRLGGMSLDSRNVIFFHKNTAGEIDTLILNDATGDLYSYGILTSIQETDVSYGGTTVLNGVYQYDVAGQTYNYVLQNGILNQAVGPICIQGSLQSPDKFAKLTDVTLVSVDAINATTKNNITFPMWDSVAVYELENNTYRISSLERVRSGYTLDGYYDKEVSEGGCIRVIVARPQ